MLLAAQLFMEDLEAKELNYSFREAGDDVIVNFPYDGKFTNFVFSGNDGCYVSMYTVFESVPADKVPDMLVVCNSLNAKYKWLKFYIDKDSDLMIEDDAILTPEDSAAECFELLARRINILKDVKPIIMKAIYG